MLEDTEERKFFGDLKSGFILTILFNLWLDVIIHQQDLVKVQSDIESTYTESQGFIVTCFFIDFTFYYSYSLFVLTILYEYLKLISIFHRIDETQTEIKFKYS